MSVPVRKALFAVAVAIAAIWPAAAAAQATAYPTKPVRLINPFAPGGAVDIVGRAVAQELAKQWGQPVIVDNRPGAGTTIGAGLVARATPDGYTMLVTSVSTTVAASVYKNLPFDAAKDFAPVAILAQTPLIFAVNPSVPAKTLQEFIGFARGKPGGVSFSSAGAGTITHLAGEFFKLTAKIDGFLHVPYKGGAPSIAAATGGEVQAVFEQSLSILPQARTGKLRAIAVTSAKRADFAPEIPTFAESGVPGFEVIVWNAILAPSGTPRAIINRVNADINRVLQQPEIRERFSSLGLAPGSGTAAAFSDFFRQELARWARVSKEAGVKIE
ncbi:MAG: tripartite tricarboxylate transporter substrate binding protein [Betaproteobacteria bacterium]|nr:tripartite tricarboxylate transporter substrate binding protein [Betaproteobacteria bacterium]